MAGGSCYFTTAYRYFVERTGKAVPQAISKIQHECYSATTSLSAAQDQEEGISMVQGGQEAQPAGNEPRPGAHEEAADAGEEGLVSHRLS